MSSDRDRPTADDGQEREDRDKETAMEKTREGQHGIEWIKRDEEREKRMRQRNWALFILLWALVALFFIISVVKMS